MDEVRTVKNKNKNHQSFEETSLRQKKVSPDTLIDRINDRSFPTK